MDIIGNIVIDFDIFSHTTKRLIVGDVSDWIYAQNKPSYISITLPGSKKSKTFPFKKHNLNVFNSHNLGLSCLSGDCKKEEYVDLPDGIYTVNVKSSYQDIENTKFFLKTDIFELEFAKVLVKYGFEYLENNTLFLNKMMELKGILTVSKSHAKLGDFAKAQRFFDEARKMLKEYMDCKDCL